MGIFHKDKIYSKFELFNLFGDELFKLVKYGNKNNPKYIPRYQKDTLYSFLQNKARGAKYSSLIMPLIFQRNLLHDKPYIYARTAHGKNFIKYATSVKQEDINAYLKKLYPVATEISSYSVNSSNIEFDNYLRLSTIADNIPINHLTAIKYKNQSLYLLDNFYQRDDNFTDISSSFKVNNINLQSFTPLFNLYEIDDIVEVCDKLPRLKDSFYNETVIFYKALDKLYDIAYSPSTAYKLPSGEYVVTTEIAYLSLTDSKYKTKLISHKLLNKTESSRRYSVDIEYYLCNLYTASNGEIIKYFDGVKRSKSVEIDIALPEIKKLPDIFEYKELDIKSVENSILTLSTNYMLNSKDSIEIYAMEYIRNIMLQYSHKEYCEVSLILLDTPILTPPFKQYSLYRLYIDYDNISGFVSVDIKPKSVIDINPNNSDNLTIPLTIKKVDDKNSFDGDELDYEPINIPSFKLGIDIADINTVNKSIARYNQASKNDYCFSFNHNQSQSYLFTKFSDISLTKTPYNAKIKYSVPFYLKGDDFSTAKELKLFNKAMEENGYIPPKKEPKRHPVGYIKPEYLVDQVSGEDKIKQADVMQYLNLAGFYDYNRRNSKHWLIYLKTIINFFYPFVPQRTSMQSSELIFLETPLLLKQEADNIYRLKMYKSDIPLNKAPASRAIIKLCGGDGVKIMHQDMINILKAQKYSDNTAEMPTQISSFKTNKPIFVGTENSNSVINCEYRFNGDLSYILPMDQTIHNADLRNPLSAKFFAPYTKLAYGSLDPEFWLIYYDKDKNGNYYEWGLSLSEFEKGAFPKTTLINQLPTNYGVDDKAYWSNLVINSDFTTITDSELIEAIYNYKNNNEKYQAVIDRYKNRYFFISEVTDIFKMLDTSSEDLSTVHYSKITVKFRFKRVRLTDIINTATSGKEINDFTYIKPEDSYNLKRPMPHKLWLKTPLPVQNYVCEESLFMRYWVYYKYKKTTFLGDLWNVIKGGFFITVGVSSAGLLFKNHKLQRYVKKSFKSFLAIGGFQILAIALIVIGAVFSPFTGGASLVGAISALTVLEAVVIGILVVATVAFSVLSINDSKRTKQTLSRNDARIKDMREEMSEMNEDMDSLLLDFSSTMDIDFTKDIDEYYQRACGEELYNFYDNLFEAYDTIKITDKLSGYNALKK